MDTSLTANSYQIHGANNRHLATRLVWKQHPLQLVAYSRPSAELRRPLASDVANADTDAEPNTKDGG